MINTNSHNPKKWIKIFKKRIGVNPFQELLRFSHVNYALHKLIRSKFKAGSIILEYGAGSGYHSFCFSIYSYNVICTDINEDVLNLIKKNKSKLHLNLKIKKLDIIKDEIKKERRWPLITFSDGVLEHFTKKEIIQALRNQKNADFITMCVPTKNADLDETSYGDENLYSLKEWLKLCRRVYPNSEIEVYPVSHNNLFLLILRKIVPLVADKRSKFYRYITTINKLLFKIENRFASTVYLIIKNNEK